MTLYTPSHTHDVWVHLTTAEFQQALDDGTRIYRSSQRRGLFDRQVAWGASGERIQQLGCIGERAVAKYLGLEWHSSIDTFKRPDLPHNIEVRVIGVNHYGLRIKERDDDSRRVVGIVIERGKEREPFRIPGWLVASDGKRKEWLMDPHGAKQPMYAVPQVCLRAITELQKLIQPKPAGRPPKPQVYVQALLIE